MTKILVTGKRGNISTAIAEWLRNKYGFSVDQISLREKGWEDVSFDCYDAVVHVAGVVPKEGIKPEDYYRINTQLTEDFSKKVKADGVGHFIYISSMAVYGVEQCINAEEGCISNTTECNPSSDYGKSKLGAERVLREIEDENFSVAIIRVPSIYGKGKTEYLDQYKHLNKRFSFIPNAFRKNFKSFIYIDNLSELIAIVLKQKGKGVFCPDDGSYSAVDLCSAISPKMKISKIIGWIFQTFLRGSDRIRDYYGAIYYDEQLTKVYDGRYRVVSLNEAVEKSYEK